MKHSPGPWYVNAPGRVFVATVRNFNAIAELNDYERTPETVLANAFVMAASPDLLAACEKALAAYDAANVGGKSTWSGKDVDDMRKAVRKANGDESA